MNRAPSPENQNRYRPELRQVVVGAMAAMALMNAAPAPAEAERAKINEKLTLVEDLPGYGIEVSKESQQQLRQATVKVVLRKKGYAGVTYTEPRPWYDNCTGVKVSLNGKNFISTALHCFSDRTGSNYGMIDGNDYVGNPKAMDYTNLGYDEVAIVDPQVEPSKRQALAKPAALLGSAQRKDMALIAIKPLSGEKKPPRTIGEIPAIKLMGDTLRPKPGQKVKLISAPMSLVKGADRRPESGTMLENDGVYLGRVPDPVTSSMSDLVGIRSQYKSKDACRTGGSGGSFIATVKGKSVVSGPMTIRYNRTSDKKKYGEEWERQWDFMSFSLARDLQKNGVKNARGADLVKSNFTTICAFTVNSEAALKNIAGAIGKYPQQKPANEFGSSPVGEVK